MAEALRGVRTDGALCGATDHHRCPDSGTDPERWPLRWEISTGSFSGAAKQVDRLRYQRLAVVADSTDNLGHSGTVRLRLPVAELSFYDAFNRWVGSCATACRLRLRTASTRLGLSGAQRLLDQSVGGERRGAYDLYVDGVLHARAWAQGGATIDLEKGAFVGD